MNFNVNDASEDELAARRRAIMQEQIRSGISNGDPIVVTPSGLVERESEAQQQDVPTVQLPQGKLA